MEEMNVKNITDVNKLYDLVEDFYSYKAKMISLDDKKREVVCILYESFVFGFSIDEGTGVFGAGLMFNTRETLITLLGEPLATNGDEISIIETLKRIDNYCRVRLPDKFLEAYGKAYKK